MFNGKNKALTFSYDDGVYQDARLAEIFNRYGLKCTFNLNSALFDPKNNWTYRKAHCAHMREDELKKALAGHEIAVHGAKHLNLAELCGEEVKNELLEDKKSLERMWNTQMQGMAYAYGAYNEEVKNIVKECGLRFARTVRPTHSFEPQTDLLEFHPTCHHNDEKLFELAEKFLSLSSDTPAIFYVWGHSYEFDGDDNWERIERFCQMMAGKDDIFYGTNSEVLLD